jgi:hypothetical protein
VGGKKIYYKDEQNLFGEISLITTLKKNKNLLHKKIFFIKHTNNFFIKIPDY